MITRKMGSCVEFNQRPYFAHEFALVGQSFFVVLQTFALLLHELSFQLDALHGDAVLDVDFAGLLDMSYFGFFVG